MNEDKKRNAEAPEEEKRELAEDELGSVAGGAPGRRIARPDTVSDEEEEKVTLIGGTVKEWWETK